MTIQQELEGGAPLFVRHQAIRDVLQTGPWLWPVHGSAGMPTALHLAGSEPTTRVGETLLVTVRDGQVSV